MKLESFMNQYGTRMGFLEKSFLKNIYYKDYGEKGLDLIEPEVNIPRNDGSGRQWRIDFVIKTKKINLLLKLMDLTIMHLGEYLETDLMN